MRTRVRVYLCVCVCELLVIVCLCVCVCVLVRLCAYTCACKNVCNDDKKQHLRATEIITAAEIFGASANRIPIDVTLSRIVLTGLMIPIPGKKIPIVINMNKPIIHTANAYYK